MNEPTESPKNLDIITGEEIKEGKAYKIKNDPILNLLVKIKKITKTYKGNNLYVSEKNLEEYKKKRKRFETNMIILSVLISLLLIMVLASTISNFSIEKALSNIFTFLLLAIMLFSFGILNYLPSIEDKPVDFGVNKDGKEDNNTGKL